ncbi:MAG TPA: hypothetical protein VMY43_07450 [Methanothrix sp.]|nr:hypothetical protein [Methanothrix sp.]
MPETGLPVAFCWRHYLELAEDLATHTTDEAKLRAAISRAYYAAFCNARNYMINNDHNSFPSGQKQYHKYLVQYYKGEADGSKTDNIDGTREQIGKDLDSMRHDRRKVDYDDRVDNLDKLNKKVLDVIKRSKRVVLNTEIGGF